MWRSAFILTILAAPLSAQSERGLALRERITGLQNRQIQQADPYQDEIAADLGRIEAASDVLFGQDRSVQIVLLTQEDCGTCARAETEFSSVVSELDVKAHVLNADDPDISEAIQTLGLDMLPSYVMQDRMIRGHIPAFVLKRYLTE